MTARSHASASSARFWLSSTQQPTTSWSRSSSPRLRGQRSGPGRLLPCLASPTRSTRTGTGHHAQSRMTHIAGIKIVPGPARIINKMLEKSGALSHTPNINELAEKAGQDSFALLGARAGCSPPRCATSLGWAHETSSVLQPLPAPRCRQGGHQAPAPDAPGPTLSTTIRRVEVSQLQPY